MTVLSECYTGIDPMSTAERSTAVEVVVRELAPADADAAAELCAELGYPVSGNILRARLESYASFDDHVIYAACARDRVVGWIDVGITRHLQAEPYGEIGGLIVSSAYRGQGIGRKLVSRAEEWIASKGLSRVVVRSRISREAAHAFYLGQNYQRLKTSAVFTKELPGDNDTSTPERAKNF